MLRSRLCLVLPGKTLEENSGLISRYRNKIDAAEIRADFLNSGEYAYLKRFPSRVDVPLIFTLRRESDGGRFKGTEYDRKKIILRAISDDEDTKWQYIDLEEGFHDPDVAARVSAAGIKVIRSFHDFNGVPSDLNRRILNIAQASGELPKAAVMPRSSRDLLRLIHVSQELKGVDKILIGMGDFGLPTRILSGWFGSTVSYASPDRKEVAPGHLDPDILTGLYRFKEIDENTKIFGVIGNPVMHSASPQIHNTGFFHHKINAVYIPFLVDDLEAFFKTAEILPIQGFSVTIPHKEGVVEFLSRKDDSVEKVKACNTVYRKNTEWMGANTDVDGFLLPLFKKWGRPLPETRRATVIGAGGASRAVIHALTAQGVRVLVLNRTIKRAERLAEEFNCLWGELTEESINRIDHHSDLIVQTTSAGMEPDVEIDPIPFFHFKGNETVYELIYKPGTTVLLKRALDSGCPIIRGEEMLLAQALYQFRLFTGKELK